MLPSPKLGRGAGGEGWLGVIKGEMIGGMTRISPKPIYSTGVAHLIWWIRIVGAQGLRPV